MYVFVNEYVCVCVHACVHSRTRLCVRIPNNVTWTKNMPLTALGYTEHGSVSSETCASSGIVPSVQETD